MTEREDFENNVAGLVFLMSEGRFDSTRLARDFVHRLDAYLAASPLPPRRQPATFDQATRDHVNGQWVAECKRLIAEARGSGSLSIHALEILRTLCARRGMPPLE